MKKLLAAIVGLSICAPAAHSQLAGVNRQEVPAQLTLEQAIAIALRNNAAYTQLLNDADVFIADRRSAFSRMLPIPSGSINTGAGPNRSTSPVGTTSGSSSNTSVSLGLSMNLWDGGASLNTYKQSSLQIETGTLSLASEDIALRSSVTLQYFQTQQAERAVQLEERLLAARKVELTDTELRFRRALVDYLGMQRAQESVEQYAHNVQNAKDALEKAKLNLLRTLGVSAPTTFDLVTPLPSTPPEVPLSADSVAQLALERNPSIRIQELNLERSEMNARIQRNSRYMPSVRLSANFSRSISGQGYSNFVDPTGRNTSMGANLGVSLPLSQLLDFSSTGARMTQLNASIDDAVIRMTSARTNLESQVRVAVIDLRGAYRSLARANASVASTKVQLEAANEKFIANLIDFFNYQRVIDDAAAAEREVLNQQFNVLSRRIALDQLLGIRPGAGGGE